MTLDRIVTTYGRTFEGTILEEDTERVKIHTQAGAVEIPKADISRRETFTPKEGTHGH